MLSLPSSSLSGRYPRLYVFSLRKLVLPDDSLLSSDPVVSGLLGANEWSRTTFIPDYETGALPQMLRWH